MYCGPLPKSRINESIYTHSVESVEVVFSPSSGSRLTHSESFTESNSQVAGEGEGEGEEEGEGGEGLKLQEKKKENKTLKRVKKLDDDDTFQDPQDQGEESLRQPAKRLRKWIDSDSDSDTANFTREEGEMAATPSVGEADSSEAVEGGGGRREEEEEESDSEGEGALAIDLEHQSQSSGEEMEREGGIQSPVVDTVELLHKDDEDGDGERGSETCGHEEIPEQGSLATLAMH